MTLRHVELLAATMPMYQRDPFDRLLAAQALEEELTLMTRDRIFERYGVRILQA